MAHQNGRQAHNPAGGPSPVRNRPMSYYPGDDDPQARGEYHTHAQRSIHQSTLGPRPPPPPAPYNHNSTYPGAQQYPSSLRAYNPQNYISTSLQGLPPPPPTPPMTSHSPSYTANSPARSQSTQGPRPYNPAAYHANAVSSYASQASRVAEAGLSSQAAPLSPNPYSNQRSSAGAAYDPMDRTTSPTTFHGARSFQATNTRASAYPEYNSGTSPMSNHDFRPSSQASSAFPASRPPYPSAGASIDFPQEPTAHNYRSQNSSPRVSQQRLSLGRISPSEQRLCSRVLAVQQEQGVSGSY